MKILRIFGVVLAVHAFAAILILANPGCSTKPHPASAASAPAADASAPSVTVPAAGEPAPVTVPVLGPNPNTPPPAAGFDPNAPALPSSPIRYSPTRPNTSVATALQATPVADVVPASTIVVAKGDSLWTLAKKHHIKVSDLAAANNLKTSSILREGQKLIVPEKSGSAGMESAAAAPASKPAASKSSYAKTGEAHAAAPNAVKHIVKPGETLGIIARKYGVKQGEIAVANNISNPAMIRAGQELVIPGWQAPKSQKAAPSPEAESPAPAPAAVPTIGGATTPEIGPQDGPPPSVPNNVPIIKIDEAAPASKD